MTPGFELDILARLLEDTPDLTVLQEEASWRSVQENADRFGVAPLIAYAMRKHLSADDRRWCDCVLLDSWMRHNRMLGELEFLADLFDAEGIPAIALKGPLLARRYYDPPFLRKPSMDLDLGVRAADLERASRALIERGYRVDGTIAQARRKSHHLMLDHPTRPRVELHFRLSHMALGIPLDEFFERAVTTVLPSGREIKVLDAPDQLVHLVLHLTQSRFGTLFHLAEIRRLCRAEHVRVREEAAARASAWRFAGAFRMMDVAFRVRWNEAFLPPGAALPKTWLNWRLTPGLYRAFERWSMPGRKLNLATRLYGRWLDLQMTDSPADALRWAGFLLATARSDIGSGPAWGTVKQLRFAPTAPGSRGVAQDPPISTVDDKDRVAAKAQDDFSPTTRDR